MVREILAVRKEVPAPVAFTSFQAPMKRICVMVGERGFEPPTPGPEPDSDDFGILLKSLASNCFELNELPPSSSSLLFPAALEAWQLQIRLQSESRN
jgi:hypothetical protein